MKIRFFIENKQLSIVLLLYTSIILLGLSSANLSHGDYVGVMKNLLLDGAGSEVDSNFYIAIKAFGFFSSVGIPPELVAILLGYLIVLLSFRRESELQVFLMCLFVFLPSFFLNLGKPSKETFIVFFMILSGYYWQLGRFVSASFVVLIYACVFRVYYFALGFLMLYYSIQSSRIRVHTLVFGAVSVLVIFLLYSNEILDYLASIQARRDFGFYNDDGIRRTIFKNYYSDISWASVVGNYFYAFIRLNLPLIFDVSYKDIFLQGYVIFLTWLTYRGAKIEPFLAFPLLLNFLVYPLFEPDLGSYLRHLASMFPIYFCLIFAVYKIKGDQVC